MALALERLIKDVKAENLLWSVNEIKNIEAEDTAWARIGTKNKLSGAEAKSIFKILCKKFKQESAKPTSSWQLFDHLQFLNEEKISTKEQRMDNLPVESQQPPIEEDTYVELLEVKEEEYSDDEFITTKQMDNSLDDPKRQKNGDVLNKGECSSTTPEGKNNNPETRKRKISEIVSNDDDNGLTLPEKRLAKQEIEINGLLEKTKTISVYTETDLKLNTNYTDFSSFGTYIANTLTKLPKKLSGKLEIAILKAIIDVNSEIMDRLV